jgi:hypothetical protein
VKRVKYEIDPYNRLTVSKRDKGGIFKHRLSLDGYFKTGKKNILQYIIKTPHNYMSGEELPHRINLKGSYALTKNYDILLTLSHSYRQRSKEVLLLSGNIVYAKENSLGFAVTTRNSSGGITTRTLKLSGRWKIDEKNRLSFLAERGRGQYDTLKFSGSWSVNKNNEIEYTYKKTRLKTKKKEERKITFKGFWEVIDKNRLNYQLGISGDSRFEFKASLARTGFLGRRNALIYKIGAGVSGKRFKPKIIKIFGNWKLTNRTGLVFEVGYSGGRRNHISFGAEVKLNKKDELLFLLKDRKNKPLGIEITLKRRFLGDTGLALLKLLVSKEERSIHLSFGRLF